MTDRTGASWIVYVLGALCAGAIVAAILLVGPASSSEATITRTATVTRGVVQSTVSGSGNLQAASQLNLGFKTSGTVEHIYVTQGQQVAQGQLLATLEPQSAEVTLEQAKASLQSAEANLAKEEETKGEGSTSASSSGPTADSASAASVSAPSTSSTPTTSTAPATGTAAPTATTPTAPSTPTRGQAPATRTTPTRSTRPTSTTKTTRGSDTGAKQERGATEEKETISAATREANLASARAAVRSDALTVRNDEQAVQNTKLYAPQDGTLVSLSGQVGEVVSASGTTRASSASSSSSGSASTAGASTAASASARSGAGTTASSGSGDSSESASSGSAFAVLSDLSSMQLVVALSESEIGKVKDGQIATITVEALEGRKLAAHVSEVALTSTSTSGAVSYDVTFQLDQMEPGLKLGMSATAEVVVQQAQGLSVPTSAISAGSVTVQRSGKQVRQPVTTGLAGNTSTIIRSGLRAGETVVLPAVSSSSSSATSLSSRLGSRLGGLGGSAGLGAPSGLPGGGAALFRGGG